MAALAHHAGEHALAPLLLLLLGSGGVGLLVAITHAQLAATRAKLTERGEGRDHP